MYSTTRITEKTYSEIRRLYVASFGKRVSLSSIEAKYNTTAFGVSNIGFFAVDTEGEFGAFYGVFPMILSYDNHDVLLVL